MFFNFFLISLGWTCDGTFKQYYAFFLIWATDQGTNLCLLSCRPNQTRDMGMIRHTAADIQQNLAQHLALIGKKTQNIDYIVGDNCQVNKRLANNLRVPFVGCASHRLNLAVQQYIQKPEVQTSIQQVNDLMSTLRTGKIMSLLENYKLPKPELYNKTRWSSTYNMLKKYLKLYAGLIQYNFPIEITQKIPNPLEHKNIVDIKKKLEEIENVNKELQRDDGVNINLVKYYFEGEINLIIIQLIFS